MRAEIPTFDSGYSLHLKNKVWNSVDDFNQALLNDGKVVHDLTLENCFFTGPSKSDYLAKIQPGNLEKLSIICAFIDHNDLISFLISFLSKNNKLFQLKIHLEISAGDKHLQPLIEALKKFNFRLVELDFNGCVIPADLQKIIKRNQEISAVLKRLLKLGDLLKATPTLEQLLTDFQFIFSRVELLDDLDDAVKKIALDGLDDLVISLSKFCCKGAKSDKECEFKLTYLVLQALKLIRQESPHNKNATQQIAQLTERATEQYKAVVGRFSSSIYSFKPFDASTRTLQNELKVVVEKMTIETFGVDVEVMYSKILAHLNQFSIALSQSFFSFSLKKIDKNPKYIKLKALHDSVSEMYTIININMKDDEESTDNLTKDMAFTKGASQTSNKGEEKNQETSESPQSMLDHQATTILSTGVTGHPVFSQKTDSSLMSAPSVVDNKVISTDRLSSASGASQLAS